jgi:hypothetical protein
MTSTTIVGTDELPAVRCGGDLILSDLELSNDAAVKPEK